jgi:hypothetical protein
MTKAVWVDMLESDIHLLVCQQIAELIHLDLLRRAVKVSPLRKHILAWIHTLC